MVEQLKLHIRNQPDALARLCFWYGVRLLKLAKNLKVSKRDSLKIRLVEYYVEKGGNWDRTKEVEDWQGHNLASLKYETYRFAIKLLAQSGDARNTDLYQDAIEIVAAKEVLANAHAMEMCHNSLSIAIERGEYSFAIHTVDLLDEILEDFPANQANRNLLVQNAILRDKLKVLLAEVHRFASLRRTIIEPAKEKWVETELAPTEYLTIIENLEGDPYGTEPTSPFAKIDYFSLCVLVELLRNDAANALAFAQKLIDVYLDNETLRIRQHKRYILHLRMVTLLYAQLGHENDARKTLQSLKLMAGKNPGYLTETTFAWIYAALGVSYQFSDKRLFYKALEKYSELRGAIDFSPIEEEAYRVTWWIILNHLEAGEYESALRIGNSSISKRQTLRRTILVNIRIAVLACEIALFGEDEDRIETTYKATYKFLDRNRKDYSDGIEVIQNFRAMWKTRTYRNQQFGRVGKLTENRTKIHDFSRIFERIAVELNAFNYSDDDNSST
jgi:hypothetical protein